MMTIITHVIVTHSYACQPQTFFLINILKLNMFPYFGAKLCQGTDVRQSESQHLCCPKRHLSIKTTDVTSPEVHRCSPS